MVQSRGGPWLCQLVRHRRQRPFVHRHPGAVEAKERFAPIAIHHDRMRRANRELQLPVPVDHPCRHTVGDHGSGELRLVVDGNNRGAAVGLCDRRKGEHAQGNDRRHQAQASSVQSKKSWQRQAEPTPLRSRHEGAPVQGARRQATRGGARKPACHPSRAGFRTTAQPMPRHGNARVIRGRGRRTANTRSLHTTAVRPTATIAAAASTNTPNKTGQVDPSNVTSENAPASSDLSNDSCTTKKTNPPDARPATVPPRHLVERAGMQLAIDPAARLPGHSPQTTTASSEHRDAIATSGTYQPKYPCSLSSGRTERYTAA